MNRASTFNGLSRMIIEHWRRPVAVKLILVMLFNTAWPTASYALTGGPSQPEVQSFTPISTSEMVNVFNGDFNYNIPLLDVEGYPINLSYSSGVGMEDEASCVGLGWNLNVGTINRSMRGIPDDFNGSNNSDVITKDFNMKPSRTFGVKGSFTPEIFGTEPPFNLSATFGVGYYFNNYNGFGFEKSASLSINASKQGDSPLTGGIGISQDTNEGLSIQPSVSLNIRAHSSERATSNIGTSLATSFNTRSGMKQLTLNTSIEREAGKQDKQNDKYGLANSVRSWGASSSFSLGTPTYQPTVSMRMVNTSISGRFTTGGELFGVHALLGFNAYYSDQVLDDNHIENPAFGYLYSQNGQNNNNAIHDFNREKDGAFIYTTPTLPVTSFTNDIFAATGQGTGGSFRAFRGDVGHVYDPASGSESDGYDVGVEVGVGNLNHSGGSISVNSVNTNSNRWTSDNGANGAFSHTKVEAGSLHEPVYFREANEMGASSDPSWMESLGGDEPVRFGIDITGSFDSRLDNRLVAPNGTSHNISSSKRTKRENRNALMTTLTNRQIQQGYGYMGSLWTNLNISSAARPDHIGEITTLGNDGSRYIYGIPAYNIDQYEVTFAVGRTLTQNNGLNPICNTNYVQYADADASTSNNHGLDNYYSKTSTPSYAHSFLLTALLSADYVDSDNTPGPSVDDLGSYTHFIYNRTSSNYGWRTPLGDHMANFSEGARIDPYDDKASFVYGTKEIWYINRIETKNYYCFFEYETRTDSKSVDANGVVVMGDQSCKRLVKIELYTISGYNNGDPAIKTVHFEYASDTNSLCQSLPNSSTGGGKLTLIGVYFTYQNSYKGKLSGYHFNYGSSPADNPDYNKMDVDRWGNYKPSATYACNSDNPIPNNSEFPYTRQNAVTDQYVQAWLLKSIELPSGGIISVKYEADDYAYVQDKHAMQMFKIVGAVNPNNANSLYPLINGHVKFSEILGQNRRLIFELDPSNTTDIAPYLQGINDVIYLRCLVNIPPTGLGLTQPDPEDFEYVPVYAKKSSAGIIHIDVDGNGTPEPVGYIDLQGVSPNSDGGGNMSPISKAAIQFGRLNTPQIIFNENVDINVDGAGGLALSYLQELGNFILDNDLLSLFINVNTDRFLNGCGKFLVPGKSYLRLSNPTGHKRGGGSRVYNISVSDNWNLMTGSSAPTRTYGQTYSYVLEDGRSSGVATYEPMIGGDENPFRMPVTYNVNNMLAPDDAHFVELPIGESFYPAPNVGYSRVEIKDNLPPNVNAHSTGRVVQEFYTAKDFPTVVKSTPMELNRQKTNPFSISSLLNIDARDHVTASQGFSIILNDMHGKQKGQYIYASGDYATAPISSVEYEYQAIWSNGRGELVNEVKVIHPDGTVADGEIGVHFDMITDMRESTTRSEGGGVNANLETFIVPFVPPVTLVIPVPIPSYSLEKKRFRSATTTKVIQRFGVVKKVTATDNTSVVETTNLAYDAITGQTLVTETVNNFDDKVYNLSYPAHWFYDGMGPAFQNVGYFNELSFNTSGIASLTGADQVFAVGDEVSSTNQGRGWVAGVTANSVTIIRKNGSPITGSQTVKILRSGRKNLSPTAIAQLTTLADPLQYFSSNIFEKVLQASAIEYDNGWSTYCECFTKDAQNFTTSNPFVLGTQGNWRPVRSYAYLTDREQAYYNYNTNIRRDGVFTSFKPFYNSSLGGWFMNKQNWTFASEVTQFSPFGQEIENRDALDRYSSAQFGYNHTLPVAVAANSKYVQMGFNNFEDAEPGFCGQHFVFKGGSIVPGGHTGRYSIRVSPENEARYSASIWKDCGDQGCTMSFMETNSGGVIQLTIQNGSAPYTVDYDVIYGSPTIQVSGNVVQVSGSAYSVVISVTDSKSCVALRTITR